jgi:isocitrate dehydrogenase (NAD+)
VTLIPGDGIGKEMAMAVKTIFKAANVPIDWEQFDLSGYSKRNESLLLQAMDSIRRNKVALKGNFSKSARFVLSLGSLFTFLVLLGIIYTPVHPHGHASLNVFLRKDLDIFASLSQIRNMDGPWATRQKNVDLAIIRENTEGEYSGLEHTVRSIISSNKYLSHFKFA